MARILSPRSQIQTFPSPAKPHAALRFNDYVDFTKDVAIVAPMRHDTVAFYQRMLNGFLR